MSQFQRLDAAEFLRNLRAGPAKAAKTAKDGGDERGTVADLHPPPAPALSVPDDWSQGADLLACTAAPSGYPPEAWGHLQDVAAVFMDRWAEQAAALRWDTLSVWGVHPVGPLVRYDCRGLVPLIASAGRIVAMTADTAAIETRPGARARFYRRHLSAGGVPVWELRGTAMLPPPSPA